MKLGWRGWIGGALMVAAGLAIAQDRTVVTLGTATPGGGFPVYGAAYSATINAMDPTLDVQPRNTKGSTENAPLVEAGKLDLAQATGEVTYEAIAGIGQPPAKNIRIINAMYSQSGMFIVRADSPYKTIADLKGKTIAWGAKSSGFVVLARYIMGGLGLDIDKDFQAVYLEKAADGPAMVLDGRAAAMWGGGVGWPSFNTIAKGPNGARFIAPSPGEMKQIVAKYSFLKPITLPAGSYPGQSAAVPSLGSWPFVLARASLPDDVAYRLARALHKGETMIGEKLPQAKESTLANTLAAAPSQDLIHPGVLRYMREIGLVK
jgi:TRAP transporter TAXI family solute receptor